MTNSERILWLPPALNNKPKKNACHILALFYQANDFKWSRDITYNSLNLLLINHRRQNCFRQRRCVCVCQSSKCSLHLQSWWLSVGAKWPTSIKHIPVLRWALYTHMRYFISYTFGLIPSCVCVVCVCVCIPRRLWTVITLTVPTTRIARTVLPFSETCHMRTPQKSQILIHYYTVIIIFISWIFWVLHYVVSNQCTGMNNIT